MPGLAPFARNSSHSRALFRPERDPRTPLPNPIRPACGVSPGGPFWWPRSERSRPPPYLRAVNSTDLIPENSRKAPDPGRSDFDKVGTWEPRSCCLGSHSAQKIIPADDRNIALNPALLPHVNGHRGCNHEKRHFDRKRCGGRHSIYDGLGFGADTDNDTSNGKQPAKYKGLK